MMCMNYDKVESCMSRRSRARARNLVADNVVCFLCECDLIMLKLCALIKPRAEFSLLWWNYSAIQVSYEATRPVQEQY